MMALKQFIKFRRNSFDVQNDIIKIKKRQHKKKIPAADFISYVGTVKAGFSPSSTLDTVDEITDANIIMAVVKGGEFSARSGLNTVSMAKKHPATAALKPEKAPKAIHYTSVAL